MEWQNWALIWHRYNTCKPFGEGNKHYKSRTMRACDVRKENVCDGDQTWCEEGHKDCSEEGNNLIRKEIMCECVRKET